MPEGDWKIEWDQDSISEPGEKVVLSEPLDEWVLDEFHASRFFEAALDTTRNGILSVQDLVVVKDVLIEDETPNSFHTVRMACGKRLQDIGVQDHDSDQVSGITLVEFCRRPGSRWIRTQEFRLKDGKASEVTFTINVNFLQSPCRMEAYMVKGGVREAGQFLAGVLKTMYLDPILLEFTAPKVVAMNVISPIDQDYCVMTEELDDLITYDVLFDGLFDEIKAMFDSVVMRIFGGAQTVAVSEDTIEFTLPIPQARLDGLVFDWRNLLEPGTETLVHRSLVTKNRDNGSIHVEDSLGRLTGQTSHMRILQDPLRVVSWVITFDGQRKANRKQCDEIRRAFRAILSKQASVSVF